MNLPVIRLFFPRVAPENDLGIPPGMSATMPLEILLVTYQGISKWIPS